MFLGGLDKSPLRLLEESRTLVDYSGAFHASQTPLGQHASPMWESTDAAAFDRPYGAGDSMCGTQRRSSVRARACYACRSGATPGVKGFERRQGTTVRSTDARLSTPVRPSKGVGPDSKGCRFGIQLRGQISGSGSGTVMGCYMICRGP